MKLKIFKRVLSVILILATLLVCFSAGFGASALTDSEKQAIQDEINRLNSEIASLDSLIANQKKQLADQNAIKANLEAKISAVQSKINACNKYIETCQAEIAASEAKIAESNEKIASTKERFKKRIRSIYNSNTSSTVQLLLGAESFADFLSLAELTKCMSEQDNQLVDEIVETISEIQAEIKKNEELQAQQNEIKQTLKAQYEELAQDEAEINSVISQINSTTSSLQADKNAAQKAKENYANSLLTGGVVDIPFDGIFQWPCAGTYINAPYMSNDSVHKGNHKGVDMWKYNIWGANVVSAASGTVTHVDGSCNHDYSKNYTCCGGGYGKNVRVTHGYYKGDLYMTIYAHLSSISVSLNQHVARGQVIGKVGSTGWSTGAHLHFGVAVNGAWKDPERYSYVR